MTTSLLPTDYLHLAFPALLFVYYVVSWLLGGRDPRIENVAPQYEPPPGVTPGVARYIRTGGSDGTTLAAVAAGLAAKGVVSIQPEQEQYHLELLDAKTLVSPDEAALVKTLFNVEIQVEPYAVSKTSIVGVPDPEPPKPGEIIAGLGLSDGSAQSTANSLNATSAGAAAVQRTVTPLQAVIDPAMTSEIKHHVDAIQDTFRKNLQGIYFRQNLGFAGLGILATFVWALKTSMSSAVEHSVFQTFWLLMFTTLSGLVIGGVWTSKPTRPTTQQRIGRIVLPLLFFVLPGALIYGVATPGSRGLVMAILLSVMLNSVFFVIMRAPTTLGRETLQQLAGFREFLVRVEQDRLDRVNTPAQRAELMDRFLPYAIALGVREGWGDTMAAALSNAIVER